MLYTFTKDGNDYAIYDEDGSFAIISKNIISGIWEYTEVEDSIYHSIESLKEIVKFMEENCKS